jgi:hypothetical protein
MGDDRWWFVAIFVILFLIPVFQMPAWYQRTDRLWFYPHGLNFLFAIVGVLLLFVLSFFDSSENLAREFALGAAVLIFTVGAILGGIAEWKLKSVFCHPDIKKLIEDADILLKGNDDQPGDVPNMSVMIAALSLLVAWGCIVIVLQAQTAQSLWSAVAAVLVGEAIYVFWSFERVAMKVELEALARSWAKKPSFGHHATLNVAWAKRARELNTALGGCALATLKCREPQRPPGAASRRHGPPRPRRRPSGAAPP